MSDVVPIRIMSKPGIKRDGTLFEGGNYVDGQWVRFYNGLPRKMAGYNLVTNQLPEISRGIHGYSSTGLQYLHTGGNQFLYQPVVDQFGNLSFLNNRTPGAGFAAHPDNLWQFDVMRDAISSTMRIIAHPGKNLSNIDSNATTKIFFGDATAAAVLTDTAVAAESGGICVVGPTLFKFGSDGHVAWSIPNNPTDFAAAGSGDAYIAGQKIVKGLPLRNGQGGPAILLWALDSLIRGTYSGSPTYYTFDPISESTTILSSQGVVEYDGIYYWAGIDRFMAFNGVVQEVPNNMNMDWFFDNINMAYRQKVFAFKVPRRGEIWWCYPRGTATECSHAIIFNVRESTWYDTPLTENGRSAGFYSATYTKPFLCGLELYTPSSTYKLWQHETGTDAIELSSINPIHSFFETNEMTFIDQEQPSNKNMRSTFIEPDLNQTGDMTVTVKGRANARSSTENGSSTTFHDTASDSYQQIVPLKSSFRLMRFRFDSNTQGGDYYLGKTVAHIGPSDERITS